jgi:coenzyme F420-0:L-glutamate ligase/coenzyme F420-1:gamma-L-glutamate ligase
MAERPMAELHAYGIAGIPEIAPGDDLPALIAEALDGQGLALADGDILVVTSKIVSKAEGRIIAAADREDAITAETVRIVASRAHAGGITRIVENRQGIVQAAAGVDASNTPDGTVLLLPEDPDASARSLATALRASSGARVGVIVSDTLGRAWREGQIDAAIGAAGVLVLDDLRGSTDTFGHTLTVTQAAVGDELASATDLVKGKASATPVALVRGLGHLVTDSLDTPARALARSAETDMFRFGTDEAIAEGHAVGYAAGRAEALDELSASGADTGADTDADTASPALHGPVFRSLAFRDLPAPDFADVVISRLPPGASTDPAVWARAIFSAKAMPRSVAALLGLRQLAVPLVGIPRAPRGTFRVAEIDGEEALVSADDAHLDFRCAIGVDAAAGLVRVTTAVRLKNARGRAYFRPVRLVHAVIVASMLKRAARVLRPKWYE